MLFYAFRFRFKKKMCNYREINDYKSFDLPFENRQILDRIKLIFVIRLFESKITYYITAKKTYSQRTLKRVIFEIRPFNVFLLVLLQN